MKLWILNLLLLFTISGCSVGMAMSGKEEPDLSVCKLGEARRVVELELGSPISFETAESGRLVCVYDYEVGNEPSSGRAIGHGAMDLLTLGLWEVVGTPIEATKGDSHKLMIIYDSDDKVVALNTVTEKHDSKNNGLKPKEP